MAFGEHSLDRGRLVVRIAVQAAPRPVDRCADDVGVREIRPFRAREIQHRNVLERECLLFRSALAQCRVHLGLLHVLELAVVVEHSHRSKPESPRDQPPRGAMSGPGP